MIAGVTDIVGDQFVASHAPDLRKAIESQGECRSQNFIGASSRCRH
jgi:hypothetical protein